MRRRLLDAAHQHFGVEAPWVQRHVANCPKCQKRLAGLTKVDIALSVIKSQAHRLDLLTRANTAAIRMLSNQLRQTEAADKLKQAKPEPSFTERYAGTQNSLVNVAACLAVLLLAKAGIFASLDKARTRGEAVMKQYYTTRAGEDLAGEVFKSLQSSAKDASTISSRHGPLRLVTLRHSRPRPSRGGRVAMAAFQPGPFRAARSVTPDI